MSEARTRKPHPARRARLVTGTASLAGIVALTGWLAVANAPGEVEEGATELAAASPSTVSVPNESDVVFTAAPATTTTTAAAATAATAAIVEPATTAATAVEVTTTTSRAVATTAAATPAAPAAVAQTSSRGS